MHTLTKYRIQVFATPATETLVIYDGNATFYQMKEVPGNFRLICQKLFDMMSKCDVIFSTDSYKQDSIKAIERQRRGTSEKLIIRGASTKKPADWKAFLANNDNKEQFINLLVSEWSRDEYASKIKGRYVTVVSNGAALQLTSHDGMKTQKTVIAQLESSQEESDTRVVVYCKYAAEKGYHFCHVKSPDSDVFFILLHHCQTIGNLSIFFDTGS